MDARPINNGYYWTSFFVVKSWLWATKAKVGSCIIFITAAILAFLFVAALLWLYFLRIGYKRFNEYAHFEVGINSQSAQDASLCPPPATMMEWSNFPPTSELCGKGVAGGSFSNTPCRVWVPESSQCTSTGMEQPCSSGTLSQLGHLQNGEEGCSSRGQSLE